MNNKYAIHIFWSEDDSAYVAICDEFPNLSALGETREEALREAQEALDLTIETYVGRGLSLPTPTSILAAA